MTLIGRFSVDCKCRLASTDDAFYCFIDVILSPFDSRSVRHVLFLIDVLRSGGPRSPIQFMQASEILRAGMVRRFTVLGTRYEVVQLSMAVHEKAIMWQRLRQMQEEDCTIPGTVISSNRGGVMVTIMNTRGFVPNSHIGPVADKESLMGTELQLKFLEVDEGAGKLLLSARRVRSADSLANYRVGDVVEGVVTKVTHFGAFLELADGISGLLHISQVSHDRVMNMEKLINVGDRMKV